MKLCTNNYDKFKGLKYKKSINEQYLFPKCKSVHTFFMKINIDIIAIDKKGKIIKIYRNTPPNRIIIAPKETYFILEAKDNSKYRFNDIIKEVKDLNL